MAEPDPEVIRRAQQGDERALEELIRGQQRYVYSIALSVLGNPADAADATQEAFLRLLRGLPTFRGETRFTTWLYRLVYNLCVDQLRRRGRPTASLDEAEAEGFDEMEDPDPRLDPLARLDQRERSARVRQALQQLPPLQRAALTLYYFDGLSYEKAAQALGVPLNTLKSHIRRARLRLARLLREEDAWTAAT